MATTTIHLSSTHEDLKDYCGIVVEALHNSEYQVIAMQQGKARVRWSDPARAEVSG